MNDTLERLSSNRSRGNFWRRLGAVVIDWGVVGIGLCVIASLGYSLTAGEIRMAQPPLAFTSCLPADAAPEGFDPAAPVPGFPPDLQREVLGDPSTFRADVVSDCRVTLFGSEVDRKASIAETSATQRFYILPVDPEFRITQPWIYLDFLFGLAMLASLALLEGLTGASLGKRVVGLRVYGRGGRPASLGAAFVRNLILWGPAAAFGLLSLAAQSGLFVMGDMTPLVVGMIGMSVIFALWPVALLVGLLASGGQPFWDNIAGVRVARPPEVRDSPIIGEAAEPR